MNKKKILVSVIIAGVLGVGIAWATGRFGHDAQVLEVREIAGQLAEKDITPEKRGELMKQMQGKLDKLTPEQRDQVWEGSRDGFQKRMEKRLDDFFALPPQERIAAMDKHIDETQQWEKEREQRRAKRDQERANQSKAGGTAVAQNGGGSGEAAPERGGDRGQGGRDGWRSMTEKERNQRRKKMLDSTTPEMRAKWTEFRRLENERRKARGLPENRRFR